MEDSRRAGYLQIKRKDGREDLVEYSGLSERFLRDLIARGELRSFRTSPRGKYLVRREWFDEWVERRISKDDAMDREVEALLDRIMRAGGKSPRSGKRRRK